VHFYPLFLLTPFLLAAFLPRFFLCYLFHRMNP
jgi:hypothetical protein